MMRWKSRGAMRFCAGGGVLLCSLLLALPGRDVGAQPENDQEAVTLHRVTACGVERWAVKTGTDLDAHLVNPKSPVNTTISTLRGLRAPTDLPLRSRIRPVETTVWRLSATIVRYKQESDSDYHLVLSDSGGRTMIAELPTPQCVGSQSPFLPSIRYVRAKFSGTFHPQPDFFTRAHIAVTISGVGFFDFQHGQSGVAPNAIELHPVLALLIGKRSAPAPAPTTSPPVSSSGGLPVHVSLSPTSVPHGRTLHIAARTRSGAHCTLHITYPDGYVSRSRAFAGTLPAGSDGTVVWSGRIYSTVKGTAHAVVQCTANGKSGSSSAPFTIV